ncbi:MAG: signal recognition particle-docking protein FtsY [Candidatus Micrarchaeaceae archaeon]
MFEGLKKRLSEAVKVFIKKEESEAREEEKHEEERPLGDKHVGNEEPAPQKKDEGKVAKESKHDDAKGNDDVVKLSVATKIKSVFTGSVRLREPDIGGFLDTLRMSMLESDVSYDTTEYFIEELHGKLLGMQIGSKRMRDGIINAVRDSLFSVLQKDGSMDIDAFIKERKASNAIPVKVLFLGPNGAGKTTTIAKVANRFKRMGMSSVLSASDTFRAAAIEQIEHHAKTLGVPVIKSSYGADPASIAFDAVKYAGAHSIDIVLIDSAGRQETNRNLINEIQKMVRVAKPDITIFVGESTAGNQISGQIKEFNKFVKIDGIILTKLDCDAKGGGALSISHTTGIPILFFGVGEKYDALAPYDPNFIVDTILPKAG